MQYDDFQLRRQFEPHRRNAAQGDRVVDSLTFNSADRLTAISGTKKKASLFTATTQWTTSQLTSDSSAPSSTSAYKDTTLNQVCYRAGRQQRGRTMLDRQHGWHLRLPTLRSDHVQPRQPWQPSPSHAASGGATVLTYDQANG